MPGQGKGKNGSNGNWYNIPAHRRVDIPADVFAIVSQVITAENYFGMPVTRDDIKARGSAVNRAPRQEYLDEAVRLGMVYGNRGDCLLYSITPEGEEAVHPCATQNPPLKKGTHSSGARKRIEITKKAIEGLLDIGVSKQQFA